MNFTLEIKDGGAQVGDRLGPVKKEILSFSLAEMLAAVSQMPEGGVTWRRPSSLVTG